MNNKSKKILIAMSGGVDSSVAAALLVKQGYDVTGAYMVNYDGAIDGQGDCWVPDYQDAVRVAAHLGISLIKLDFTKEYEEKVLDYLFEEYKKGNTPNPDVLCNKYIKFGAWLKKANELGYEMIATGHYAKKEEKNGVASLMQAKDENKDQTYFLHQISQDQLKQIIFPLGDYKKNQVRKMAKDFELPTATKEESMGICFVGKVSMKDFLKERIKPLPGNIIKSEKKEIIGKHEGLSFYTIGQRHGFSQAGGDKPLFVVKKDHKKNELIVGYENDSLLYKKEIDFANIHWIKVGEPDLPLSVLVRFRHRQELQKGKIEKNDQGFVLKMKKKQKAITPGQFAVFYSKGECLGGAKIKE